MSKVTQGSHTPGGGLVRQFVVACSAADSGLPTAVCALQFLPDNYRLVVTAEDTPEKVDALAAGAGITDRIKVTQSTGMSHATSPFLDADAVVRDGRVSFGNADDDETLDTPEALASAFLSAARLHGLYA